MVPNGWSQHKFSEIVEDTQLGTTERHKGQVCSDPIPLLKMGNLTWGGFNLSSLEVLPRGKLDKSLLLKKGDFLFNTRNTPKLVGKSAVWNEEITEAIFDNNINRISFKTGVDPFYLGAYLNNGKGKAIVNSLPAGSTSVAAIYWKDLKNIQITLPSHPEQRKIANILGTWDKAISTTEHLIDNNKQQKNALMQQVLTGKRRLLDDSGKAFEGEWEKHPIGKLCKSIVPGRNKPKLFEGKIPWVTTPEFQGRFIPSKLQRNYISQSTLSDCGGKLVPKGAVVMAAVGELGLTAIATESLVLNQQLHAFICNKNINNVYLFYWLANQKPYMESVASKTTIMYMNKTNCESIPVLVPSLFEQQKIAAVLTTADKEIELLEQQFADLKQEKKALMQQLLTGKRRVIV